MDDTCYDLTIDECEERAGVWFGLGVDCSDPIVECEGGDPDLGACCIDEDCTEMDAEKCWENGGAFYGPGTDCDDANVSCCEESSSDDPDPVDDDEPAKGCATAPSSPLGTMLPVLGLALLSLIGTRRDN